MDAAASYRLIVPYAAALRGEPELRAQSRTGLTRTQTVREAAGAAKTGSKRKRDEDGPAATEAGSENAGPEEAGPLASAESGSNGWFLNETVGEPAGAQAEMLGRLRAYAETPDRPPPRISRDV